MNTSSFRYTLDRLRHAWFRYRHRDRIEDLYATLIARLDKAVFAERLRPFWDPFAGSGMAKYLNLDVWLRETILRYLLVAPDGSPTGRVVDLGSGTGYFLWVCRELGHEILGIDLAGEPLYDTCIDVLGVPRNQFRIEPERSLCDLGSDVVLITAFMACFDRYEDGTPWDTTAWSFFLSDTREHLEPGGRLAMKFNADATTGALYSEDTARLFLSANGYACRRLMDYVILIAR